MIYGILIDSLVSRVHGNSVIVTDSTVNYVDLLTPIDENGNEKTTKTCPLLGFKYIYPTFWKLIDTLELCESYSALNKKKYHFNPKKINCSTKLIQISSDSLKRIFSLPIKNHWEYFRNMFPKSNGTFMISRVAFNYKMTQAVVYTEQMEDYLNGEGADYLLLKVKGKWEIQCRLRRWAS